MKVLVTGGAGFIGSHLVEYHLNQGDEVIAIDDLSSGCKENLVACAKHPKLTFIQADILHEEVLEKALNVVDRIYNMAAIVGMQKVF
jgi:UDP-glucose 4-epimerase